VNHSYFLAIIKLASPHSVPSDHSWRRTFNRRYPTSTVLYLHSYCHCNWTGSAVSMFHRAFFNSIIDKHHVLVFINY